MSAAVDIQAVIARAEKRLISPFRLCPIDQHGALARALHTRGASPKQQASGHVSTSRQRPTTVENPQALAAQIVAAGRCARGEIEDPEVLPAGLAGDIIRAGRRASSDA